MTNARLWWGATAVSVAAVTFDLLTTYVNNWPGAPAAPIYVVTMGLVGFGYLVAGLVAWRRRPVEQIGLIFVVIGLLWYLPAATNLRYSVAFTLGNALSLMYQPGLAHAALTWPSGHFRSKAQRNVVILDYGWVAANNLLRYLFFNPHTNGCSAACPANFIMADGSNRVFNDVTDVTSAIGFPFTLVIAALIIRNWRSTYGYSRREMAGLIWVVAPVAAFVLLGNAGGLGISIPNLFLYGVAPLVLLLPPVVLLATLVRARLAQGAVRAALVELEPGPSPARLQGILAAALGDPTLQLGFRQLEGNYLDAAGTAVDIERAWATRVVSNLDDAGGTVLVLDGALRSEPQLVRVATNVASLALQHSQLQAEVQAQLEQVRASRARIVEAGDTARRRLERDIHDGAQQRLVTLSLALGMARDRAAGSDPDLESLLESAAKEAKEALAELRELARGIHPAVLSESGLRGALAALVERSPVEAKLGPVPDERYPPTVEATAYFVASEALANVAKHAVTSTAWARVSRLPGKLVVEVTDDGPGGAQPEDGSGLRGLADRVASVGGSFSVESPLGRGTRVRAEIPCE